MPHLLRLVEEVLGVRPVEIQNALQVSEKATFFKWKSGRSGMGREYYKRLLSWLELEYGLTEVDLQADDVERRFQDAKAAHTVEALRRARERLPGRHQAEAEMQDRLDHQVRVRHFIPTGQPDQPYLVAEPTEPLDLDATPAQLSPGDLRHLYGAPLPLPAIESPRLARFLLDDKTARMIGLQWIEAGLLARLSLPDYLATYELLQRIVQRFREARVDGEVLDAELLEKWNQEAG